MVAMQLQLLGIAVIITPPITRTPEPGVNYILLLFFSSTGISDTIPPQVFATDSKTTTITRHRCHHIPTLSLGTPEPIPRV
jgi:hypothetical protein